MRGRRRQTKAPSELFHSSHPHAAGGPDQPLDHTHSLAGCPTTAAPYSLTAGEGPTATQCVSSVPSPGPAQAVYRMQPQQLTLVGFWWSGSQRNSPCGEARGGGRREEERERERVPLTVRAPSLWAMGLQGGISTYTLFDQYSNCFHHYSFPPSSRAPSLPPSLPPTLPTLKTYQKSISIQSHSFPCLALYCLIQPTTTELPR